jgi:hypothetical protein
MIRKKLRVVLILFMLFSICLGVAWVYEYPVNDEYGLTYYIAISQHDSQRNNCKENYSLWLPFPENHEKPCSELINQMIIQYGNCTYSLENTEKGYALRINTSGFLIIRTNFDLANHTDIRSDKLTMFEDFQYTWAKSERSYKKTNITVQCTYFWWDKLKYRNIFGNEHIRVEKNGTFLSGSLGDGWDELSTHYSY